MIAGRWRFIFLVIFGLLGFAGMAWGDTLTALGLTLGLAFSLEAAAVVGTLAGPTIAALGQGMASSIAVGGGIGAVNLAAVGLVAGIIGLVGIAVVAGIVAAIVVPAIISRSGPGPTAGAGASGEATDDTAAANLAAAMASFPENPPPQPTVRFSVNSTTGEVAITPADGVVVGDVPGSPPGSSPGLGLGLTLGQVNDVNVTNPSESPGGLPGIGEPAPGTDAVSVEASPDVGEYGWIDGVCRHYATGLNCAAYQEHEQDEYRHDTAVPSLATGWLMLLGSGLAGYWVIRRPA